MNSDSQPPLSIDPQPSSNSKREPIPEHVLAALQYPERPMTTFIAIMWTAVMGVAVSLFVYYRLVPVSQTQVKFVKTVSDCSAIGCTYSVFDGSNLYPISLLQSLKLPLKSGGELCVIKRSFSPIQITSGACP